VHLPMNKQALARDCNAVDCLRAGGSHLGVAVLLKERRHGPAKLDGLAGFGHVVALPLALKAPAAASVKPHTTNDGALPTCYLTTHAPLVPVRAAAAQQVGRHDLFLEVGRLLGVVALENALGPPHPPHPLRQPREKNGRRVAVVGGAAFLIFFKKRKKKKKRRRRRRRRRRVGHTLMSARPSLRRTEAAGQGSALPRSLRAATPLNVACRPSTSWRSLQLK
jgi:hypothetical protein